MICRPNPIPAIIRKQTSTDFRGSTKHVLLTAILYVLCVALADKTFATVYQGTSHYLYIIPVNINNRDFN